MHPSGYTIKNKNHCVLLVIKDNGRGFDNKKIKKGNGLRNMEERTFAIGAMITINSAENEGTTVQLELPLT